MSQKRIDKLRTLGQGLSEQEFDMVLKGYLQSKIPYDGLSIHAITENVKDLIKKDVEGFKNLSGKERSDMFMPF